MRDGTTLSGEKSKSKTELIHRKSRSGVSWAVAFAYGSCSSREMFLDQFLSLPDLTLLEVELLAFCRVSQNLLSHKTYTRTIQTARTDSLGQKQIHGNKGKSKQ